MAFGKKIWLPNGTDGWDYTDINRHEDALDLAVGTDWAFVTLSATWWAHYVDTANWHGLRWKKAAGIVYLEGMVQSVAQYAFGTPASCIVGTLPVAARPAKNIMGLWRQSDTSANRLLLRMDVKPNGELTITNEVYGGSGNTGVIGYAGPIIPPWEAGS